VRRCRQARPPARAAPRPIPARDGQARRAGTEAYLRLKAALMGLLRGDWQRFGAVEGAIERIVAVWTTNADGPPLRLKYVKLFAIQNTSSLLSAWRGGCQKNHPLREIQLPCLQPRAKPSERDMACYRITFGMPPVGVAEWYVQRR
jgi:hypothetical protein